MECNYSAGWWLLLLGPTQQGRRWPGASIQLLLLTTSFLNDVAFGHKELWQTLVADRLSVTSQMLWHLATTNYGGIWS